jgi:hypothetical protein
MLRIDRGHIEIIDKFSKYRDDGFNLLEFVRFFLNIVQHDRIENLYITIGINYFTHLGLIDLFKTISTFVGS